jgi:hypothetical protein
MRHNSIARFTATAIIVAAVILFIFGIIPVIAVAVGGLGAGWGSGSRLWLVAPLATCVCSSSLFLLACGAMLLVLTRIQSNLAGWRERQEEVAQARAVVVPPQEVAPAPLPVAAVTAGPAVAPESAKAGAREVAAAAAEAEVAPPEVEAGVPEAEGRGPGVGAVLAGAGIAAAAAVAHEEGAGAAPEEVAVAAAEAQAALPQVEVSEPTVAEAEVALPEVEVSAAEAEGGGVGLGVALAGAGIAAAAAVAHEEARPEPVPIPESAPPPEPGAPSVEFIEAEEVPPVPDETRGPQAGGALAAAGLAAVAAHEGEAGSEQEAVTLETAIQEPEPWDLQAEDQIAAGAVAQEVGARIELPQPRAWSYDQGTSNVVQAVTMQKAAGMSQIYAEKLKELGITTTAALLRAGCTPQGRRDLAQKTGISPKQILTWVNHVDLARIKGISEGYADLLEASGVDTVPELSQRNADNLLKKLTEVNEAQRLVRRLPTLGMVASWIAQAKELPRIVIYK